MKGFKCPERGFIPNPEGELAVPCGKCRECLKERATEWALRCQHEMSMHKQNSFITLTYDERNLRNTQDELRYDIQCFFKRMRKNLKKKIRYIYSVEYGSQTQRPHFHALIFGHDFTEQKLIKKTKKGFPIFRSKQLEDLWPNGHSSIGSATVQSAYYIAAYALKQHSQVDQETGEVLSDYMRCSKRPAIGLEYLKKHKKQLVDSKTHLPRYYRKKLEEIDPDLLEKYENQLMEKISYRDDRDLYAKYEIENKKPKQSELRNPEKDVFGKKYEQYLKNHLEENARRLQHETKNLCD